MIAGQAIIFPFPLSLAPPLLSPADDAFVKDPLYWFYWFYWLSEAGAIARRAYQKQQGGELLSDFGVCGHRRKQDNRGFAFLSYTV